MVLSIQTLQDDLHRAEQEIRKLKLEMQKVAGGGTRLTQATGVLQPINGGTGVTCDIKGAVTLWQNNSAATRTAGDVVVENGDRLFGTTTSVGSFLVIGVVIDSTIAAGISGCIRHTGYQATVKVQGAVTAGHFLRTSATAARAEDAGTTPVDGCFAIALTANGGGAGTVTAMLLGGAVHQTVNGVSINQYAFAPDVAPGVDVVAGDQQGSIYHSGPVAETATLLYCDVETAAGTTVTVTVQYGDTNDLDTVASWTTIATKAMAGMSDSQSSMTNAAIPANRLIRFNVTSISGTAPRDMTVTLQVRRALAV